MVKSINKKKSRGLLKYLVIAVVLTIITGVMAIQSSNAEENDGIADRLVRLHVIANSDSDKDQALKLKVRDKIIEYMKKELANSKNVDQTKEIINKDIDKIEKIAEDEVKKEGYKYHVKAVLGNFPFPTKSYGDIVLPAGTYQALRVVIGEGQGRNWWCVLFPPLCFVDASHGTIPDSVKEDLKENLTDDQYEMVTSQEEDLPVKVKFKSVEIIQDLGAKVSGFFSSIF